jgi:hypothetical protein
VVAPLEPSPFLTWTSGADKLGPSTHMWAFVTLIFLIFRYYWLNFLAIITVVSKDLPESALRSRSGEKELFTYFPVRRDGLSLFDDGDIPWNNLAGRNLLLFSLANDLVQVEASTKR